jgi:hypothetical protein
MFIQCPRIDFFGHCRVTAEACVKRATGLPTEAQGCSCSGLAHCRHYIADSREARDAMNEHDRGQSIVSVRNKNPHKDFGQLGKQPIEVIADIGCPDDDQFRGVMPWQDNATATNDRSPSGRPLR